MSDDADEVRPPRKGWLDDLPDHGWEEQFRRLTEDADIDEEMAHARSRPDGIPYGSKLAWAVDRADRYDPDAVEDAILHANPRALAALVREAEKRVGKKFDINTHWRTIEDLRLVARQLAAAQTSKRETRLQHIVNPWRMSQTEVSLRLAAHLVKHDMVTSDVSVHLSVREITRYRHPMYYIHGFMKAHGATLVAGERYPYGTYAVAGARQGIRIAEVSDEGSVIAEIGPGSRLIVDAFAGPTRNTPGSLEHVTLRRALGTALMRTNVGREDLLAVALPRSRRTRKLVNSALESPRVAATGISIVTVGPNDQIDGLPLPGPYRPPELSDA